GHTRAAGAECRSKRATRGSTSVLARKNEPGSLLRHGVRCVRADLVAIRERRSTVVDARLVRRLVARYAGPREARAAARAVPQRAACSARRPAPAADRLE